MIKNILDLLKIVSGETENIRIAQGKFKLPETLGEAWTNFKEELKNKKQ